MPSDQYSDVFYRMYGRQYYLAVDRVEKPSTAVTLHDGDSDDSGDVQRASDHEQSPENNEGQPNGSDDGSGESGDAQKASFLAAWEYVLRESEQESLAEKHEQLFKEFVHPATAFKALLPPTTAVPAGDGAGASTLVEHEFLFGSILPHMGSRSSGRFRFS